MGNLAMWAGIGGAAKGGEKYLTMRQEQDDRKEMADIDTARQKMLARIRGEESRKTARVTGEESRKGIEKSGQVQAETVIPAKTGSALEIQEAGAEDSLEQIGARGEEERQTLAVGESSRAGREADRRVWQSSENRLDRESREKIASMAGKGGSAGQEILKRHYGRYSPQKLSEAIVMENGFPIGAQDAPAVYDELSGSWYLSKGSKLMYPNDAGKTPREVAQVQNYREHNDKDLEMLYGAVQKGGPAEEQATSAFYQKFGYLPKGLLQQIMARDINSEMSVVMRSTPAATPGTE